MNDLGCIAWIITILWFLVMFVGMVMVDHRLHKIQTLLENEVRKKAWMERKGATDGK